MIKSTGFRNRVYLAKRLIIVILAALSLITMTFMIKERRFQLVFLENGQMVKRDVMKLV